MEHPKRILDYSSPAQEQTRERKLEEERREKLEDYNESTFGERRPIASAFLRWGVFVTIVSLLIIFLPRGIGRPLAWLASVGYTVWEIRRDGWSALRWPFRWW